MEAGDRSGRHLLGDEWTTVKGALPDPRSIMRALGGARAAGGGAAAGVASLSGPAERQREKERHREKEREREREISVKWVISKDSVEGEPGQWGT